MKIAIVGNGKLSKNYGKQIDKCDFVIRFNKAKIKGYEKLVGTKTSILALVGETSLSYKQAANNLDRELLMNTDEIWFSSKKENKEYEKSLNKLKNCNVVVSHSNHTTIAYRPLNEYTYIHFECYKNICNGIIEDFKFNKNPSTGINILCYILNECNVINDKSYKLNIYGFDCFESGHYFDNEKRNNSEFHDLNIERKILEHLKQYKNIKFFS